MPISYERMYTLQDIRFFFKGTFRRIEGSATESEWNRHPREIQEQRWQIHGLFVCLFKDFA